MKMNKNKRKGKRHKKDDYDMMEMMTMTKKMNMMMKKATIKHKIERYRKEIKQIIQKTYGV